MVNSRYPGSVHRMAILSSIAGAALVMGARQTEYELTAVPDMSEPISPPPPPVEGYYESLRKPKALTDVDNKRIAAAEAKRQRKAEKRLRLMSPNCDEENNQ